VSPHARCKTAAPSLLSHRRLWHDGAVNDRVEEIASAVPADLNALPRLRGFRLRGLEMTRLETFVDATFAFAITTLVIAGQNVPTDVSDLLAAFRNVPAFVASTIVLGIFWRGHWLWSRRFGLEDGASIFISWALLLTILIYIYPMKVVFDGMWYLLSNRQFGQPLNIRSAGQARMLFALYAAGFTAISMEILLLNWRAWRLREPLRLDALERRTTRGELTGWMIPVAIGVLSLVLALTLPVGKIAWSGWVYFTMAVLVPLHSAVRRRAIAKIAARAS
jgi:hypothetical protein